MRKIFKIFGWILGAICSCAALAEYENEPLFTQAKDATLKKDYATADRLFERLGRNPSYTARSYRSRGTLAFCQGKVEESDSFFRRAADMGDATALWNLTFSLAARKEGEKIKNLLPTLERAANNADDALAGYLIALVFLDKRQEFLARIRIEEESRILRISKETTDGVYVFLQQCAEERDKPLLAKLEKLKAAGEMYHN